MFTDVYRGREVSRFMRTYALTVSLFMFLFIIATIHHFNTFIFTWVLCIYVILDKGCHISCFSFEKYGVQPHSGNPFVLVTRSLITL